MVRATQAFQEWNDILESPPDGLVDVKRPAPGLIQLVFCDLKTRNAMSASLILWLHKLFVENKSLVSSLALEGEVRLLSLESSLSGFFASGGHLKEALKATDNESTRQDSKMLMKKMRLVCKSLHSLPVKTISALSGRCIGGGAELALATDTRVLLSTDATLEFAQTSWGLPSGWGGLSRLQSLLGHSTPRASAFLFFEGVCLKDDELVRLGLIDQDFRNSKTPLEAYRHWINKKAEKLGQVKPQLWKLLCKATTEDDSCDSLFDELWLSEDHVRLLEERLKS